MEQNQNITVIYIMWLPMGQVRFSPFLQSYLQHPAGLPHDLVIVFKGESKEPNLIDNIKAQLAQYQVAYIALYHNEGFDIDTYRFAAQQVNSPYCVFMNTRSVILADNWLQKLAAPFSDNKTGLVSATGSYQSLYSTVFAQNSLKPELAKGLAHNVRKYKLLLKTFFYWRFLFKPFPNPHVRTNAFMMRRTDFLNVQLKLLATKFDAYQLESGKQSLTNQVLAMGLEVFLVDRHGNQFTTPNWASANVFWQGQQQNLLVADNQTELYEQATETEKKSMTKLAWGIS